MFKLIFFLIFFASVFSQQLSLAATPAVDITSTNLQKNPSFVAAQRAIQTDLTLMRKQKLMRLAQVKETKKNLGTDYEVDAFTKSAGYKYLVSVVGQSASIKGIGKKAL